MLSGLTLIRYSTMLWVYLGIRFFLCLGFTIGIMYFGAKLKQKSLPVSNQPTKSRFVSLGIGWSPRKEERRKGMIAERRQDRRTEWIATLTLILGIILGHVGSRTIDKYFPSTLEEVLITSVHADGSYVVLDKYKRKFDVKWCSGPDDLAPGNKLHKVYYRQENGCKRIRGMYLGYSVYTHKDGTRITFPIPEEIAYAR